MKILLVRHGETDWNVQKKIQGKTDIPLNEAGINQAQELAEKLAVWKRQIIGIYTSRLKRAAKTAEIIAKRLGKEYKETDGLEEIDLGLWEGLSWEQAAERFPEEYKIWHDNRRYTRSPEGESYQELLERFLPALQKIVRDKQGEDGDVVIVTHSADIMTFMSCLNDTPFYEMVKRYKTANAAVIEIEAENILVLDASKEHRTDK